MALEVNLGDTGRPRPAVLLILDGFGVAADSEGNAITRAKTPTFSMLTQRYPAVTLRSSGEEVGLQWGEMGNSEVGHVAIGAGRIYRQALPRINEALKSGDFFENEAFLAAAAKVKKTGGTLHILGLFSGGNVHSSETHGLALLEFAKKQKLKDVAVHVILDGRDTLYNSGFDFVKKIEEKIQQTGVGYIASLCGRFYAMDRDNRWDRVEKAYKAIALGQSQYTTERPDEAIMTSYAKEVYDEEFPPTVVTRGKNPAATIKPGDAVIFFNYRADRARELTKAITLPAWPYFPREYVRDVLCVTMTEYEKHLPVSVAFSAAPVVNSLAEVLSHAGLTQLHIAETEKYGHVTYFLNCMREEPFPHEERVLVPSPKVATYNLAPKMSAELITERILKEIDIGNYDVIIANFANADMVGHSGDLDATIKAVETIDTCVGRIIEESLNKNGVVLVTADHGNAEEVRNLQTHDIDKEHSTNPVPMWIVGKRFEGRSGPSGDVPHHDLSLLPPCGILADVAPTFLALLGLPQPPEMTGQNLLS